jgi:hypothetical protein
MAVYNMVLQHIRDVEAQNAATDKESRDMMARMAETIKNKTSTNTNTSTRTRYYNHKITDNILGEGVRLLLLLLLLLLVLVVVMLLLL